MVGVLATSQGVGGLRRRGLGGRATTTGSGATAPAPATGVSPIIVCRRARPAANDLDGLQAGPGDEEQHVALLGTQPGQRLGEPLSLRIRVDPAGGHGVRTVGVGAPAAAVPGQRVPGPGFRAGVPAQQVRRDAEQPGPGAAEVGAVAVALLPGGQERLGHQVVGGGRVEAPGQVPVQVLGVVVVEPGKRGATIPTGEIGMVAAVHARHRHTGTCPVRAEPFRHQVRRPVASAPARHVS
ncbi:MAG TPA: hypothetical protein VGR06_06625 [Actinophytocola sp.]|nr:hypothetical protein [Actinophytocola sp.]